MFATAIPRRVFGLALRHFAFFLFPLLLASFALPAFAGAQCTNNGAASATSWSRWECALDVQGVGTTLAGRNPYLMKLKVTYTVPGTQLIRTGYAFWDGMAPGTMNTYRFRFRMMFPPAANPVTWTWTTSCESPAYCSADTSKTSPSLVSSGTVYVTNYSGGNPLYQGGPIRILSNQLYPLPELYQGNNRFVWMGDAAWAAPMRATTADWDAYLENRRSASDPTGLNSANARMLQIGPAPAWAGFVPDKSHPEIVVDAAGNRPFTQLAGCSSGAVVPNNCSLPNLAYWQGLENKIQAANQKGLYIFLAGVMEPYMRYPSSEEAVSFACWLAARLSGNFVIFSPGFDSPPPGANINPLIKAVGSAIKTAAPQHLVTNHWSTPAVQNGADSVLVTADQMATMHTESWLDFELYQSGFVLNNEPEIARRARQLAQVLAGHTGYPPFNTNRKAVINGEAVYDEGGTTSNGRYEFRAYRARQAGYLSWLSGALGYTHGSGGLWDWGACGSSSANVCGYQMPPGYRNFSDAMKPIGQAFKNVKWMGEALRRSATDVLITREQRRIKNQADAEDKKMVVARSRDWMIAYLPHNRNIELDYLAGNGSSAQIVNTSTGKIWNPASGLFEAIAPTVDCPMGTGICKWTNPGFVNGDPDNSDRLLILSSAATNTWFQTDPNQLAITIGRFIEGEPLSVYGLLLDGAGKPLGSWFPIHSSAGQEPADPAVGRNGKGSFLVVWSADTDGDSLSEVWGKWVEPGVGRLPSAFRISPADGSAHLQPSVAITGAGVAFVAWTRARWPIHGQEVWARSVNGNSLGDPEPICQGEGKNCGLSRVAASIAGTVTVGWVESDEALGKSAVMLQSFSSQDLRQPATTAQQANSTPASAFWLSHLHVDASGAVVAEYEGLQDGLSTGVFTQSYDALGARVGSEQQIAFPFTEPQ